MDKDELQQKQSQTPIAAGQTEVWQSAFEAQTPLTATPPPLQLTADPVPGDQEGGESEYTPETVVFDIGGFADPSNPGEGNGKGIKIVLPPDLDGPTALLQVVMAMLRLSEAEAKAVIVKEHLQWENYNPKGQGIDREGNVIHLMRFKPRFAERVAHEPETLRPTVPLDLELYKGFKDYLRDHNDDQNRDPYTQFDNWAKEEGLYNQYAAPDASAGMFGENSAMNHEKQDYVAQREAVVRYVVWERLRAKRESLAAGIGEQKTDVQSTVQSLADSFPAILDLETLRRFMPDSYFKAWVALHARVIMAQGALENGDAVKFGEDGLATDISELAQWLVGNDTENLLHGNCVFCEFEPGFTAEHAQETVKLAATENFGLEQGQQLL
jgi:hypothetical protein